MMRDPATIVIGEECPILVDKGGSRASSEPKTLDNNDVSSANT